MRKIILIITFIIFFSCRKETKKQNINTLYYPSKEYFFNSNIVKVELENSKTNFKRITDLVSDIHSVDSIPYVELIDNNILRKIILLRNDSNPIRLRNKLEITEDSIISDKIYPINLLYEILKKYYLNNGAIINYPESAQKVYVEIEIDTSKNGHILKKSLSNLVRTFDKINSQHLDTLQLRVTLSYFHQIPPPPQPPNYE
tara:strand:+ start:1497 stop:2099 length:603 start_codon:yes stop_codon:yes gene_type:complete